MRGLSFLFFFGVFHSPHDKISLPLVEFVVAPYFQHFLFFQSLFDLHYIVRPGFIGSLIVSDFKIAVI